MFSSSFQSMGLEPLLGSGDVLFGAEQSARSSKLYIYCILTSVSGLTDHSTFYRDHFPPFSE